MKGLRDVVFGFLKLAPENGCAYDISFGTAGYSLTLARAFKEVGFTNIIDTRLVV